MRAYIVPHFRLASALTVGYHTSLWGPQPPEKERKERRGRARMP